MTSKNIMKNVELAFGDLFHEKNRSNRIAKSLDFLVFQWQGLCTPSAGGLGSIPAQGIKEFVSMP